MMEGLPHQLASLEHAPFILPIAALLGGALGVAKTDRRLYAELVGQSTETPSNVSRSPR